LREKAIILLSRAGPARQIMRLGDGGTGVPPVVPTLPSNSPPNPLDWFEREFLGEEAIINVGRPLPAIKYCRWAAPPYISTFT
jgi:hypothetical protein